MENRINYITSLKDCISSRNSFSMPVTSVSTEQAFLHDNMEYQVIKQQIKDSFFYNNTNRHLKIRVEKWLSYLDKTRTNKVWLKSRNMYIKMLNLMCYCECVLAPFNVLPPEGELPTLSKNEVNRIIDQVERQLKSSGVSSRRSTQHIELTKEYAQNEMQTILFPTFSQEQKRFQTYYSNSFLQDQSQTLPFKMTQKDHGKPFETEVDESTLPFKRPKQAESRNYGISNDQYKSQIQSISQRRFSLSTKRNSKQNVGKQNACNYDTISSIKSFEKSNKATPNQNRTTVMKEIKFNQIKRPLNIPLKLKKQAAKDKQSVKLNEELIQKQYWQENSLLSEDNSNQKTPKYITKFTTQHVVTDQCVQIISFREKEGEGCDCTSNMLGGGWFSQLFKKINL